MWDLLNKADFKPKVPLQNREVSSPAPCSCQGNAYLLDGGYACIGDAGNGFRKAILETAAAGDTEGREPRPCPAHSPRVSIGLCTSHWRGRHLL